MVGTSTKRHPSRNSKEHWRRIAVRVCPLVDHHFSKCARKWSAGKSATTNKRYRNTIWLRAAKVTEVALAVAISLASSRIAYTKRRSHPQKLRQRDRTGKPSRSIKSSQVLPPRTSRPRHCNSTWVASSQQQTMATVYYLASRSSTMTPARHSKWCNLVIWDLTLRLHKSNEISLKKRCRLRKRTLIRVEISPMKFKCPSKSSAAPLTTPSPQIVSVLSIRRNKSSLRTTLIAALT